MNINIIGNPKFILLAIIFWSIIALFGVGVSQGIINPPADDIRTIMNSGRCGEVSVFVCPDNTVIQTCMSPTKYTDRLGLIESYTDRQIIASYSSTLAHWTDKTSQCTYTGSFTHGVDP